MSQRNILEEQLEGDFLSSFIRSLCLFVVYKSPNEGSISTSKNEKVNEIYSDCYSIINQKTQFTYNYICLFKFSIESILNFVQNTLVGLLILLSRYLTRICKVHMQKKDTSLHLLFQKNPFVQVIFSYGQKYSWNDC